MKGILLAGGSGSRLYPLTSSISKQILPVYDKPVIYYPLSTLMLAGIREVLIISTPRDVPMIQNLLGDGSKWGLNLQYEVQLKPEGIAQGISIAKEFIDSEPVCLILGDNLFYGNELQQQLLRAAELTSGARVFAYHVNDPQRYGVVSFDKSNHVLSIEEKPVTPQSNWAVTGLYFYDGQAVDFVEMLKPSARGELEITDLNRLYMQRSQLSVERLGRGTAWLDMGTPDSLLSSSTFVQTLEKRQGLKIACIEEIAYQKKWIDSCQLDRLAAECGNGDYGRYLLRVLQEQN